VIYYKSAHHICQT